MTVAAKDEMPVGGGGARKGRLARRGVAGHGNPWKRLWQVPLLLAGVAAFGMGVKALVKTIRPVPFGEQAKGIRALLASGAYSKAVDQINIMGNYYKAQDAQAELQELAGDAHFLAEQQQLADGAILVRTNYEWTEKHYEAAVRLGVVPTVEMNERWGVAALGLGEADKAAEKLEAAIAEAKPGEQAGLLDKHGKDLVAAYLEDGQTGRALAMVNRMLAVQEAQTQPADGAATEPADEANARVLDAIEEKTWGLCTRIQIALMAKDPALLVQAVSDAREALDGLKEHDPMGRVLAWIGRAELEQGDSEGAERDLSRARSLFVVHHLDDGRAAVLLARIAQARGDMETAEKLFREVVKSEAGTSVWAAARLGRADVTALQKGQADKDVVADYRYAIDAANEAQDAGKSSATRPVGETPELIRTEDVSHSLHGAYLAAVKRDQLDDALTFLALEKETGGPETADMAFEIATTSERRGDQMHAQAQQEEGAAREKEEEQARQMWATAAEAYLRHAKLTTLDDDASGASSWKSAELLDRAGRTTDAIAVYERLTIQRPRDPRVAEGMLALGRLFESAGELDKAVEAYRDNIDRNAKSPAAYASAVNLARCYAAIGARETKPEEKDKDYAAAETALLRLVLDNPDLKPEAREFRDSVRALGELYYERGRWSDAILRLDELVSRYPGDPGLPHAQFLLAESYRKSAQEIGAALKKNPAIANRTELEQARVERLRLAMDEFTRVIGMLDAASLGEPATAPAKAPTSLELECLKTAYMERADCAYDLADYPQAIKFYEQASARFSEERLAVEAYVQIVNSYLALKQPAEAGAAAERGRFVLKRIPDQAFVSAGAGSGPDRAYYEKLLALGKS